MPLDLKMMLYHNMVAGICDQCVERSPILRQAVERHPVQHRLWYEGHKYLRYGTFFVEI